jgi:diguanylate cyclase (GGDEF)-like protein
MSSRPPWADPAMSKPAAPTIVCVDDDELVLRTLREQLQRGLDMPCLVETAASGPEALALLDELAAEGVEVPLLISDQSMPGMAGTDFLARVHARRPQMLKIMLSGAADASAVGDAVNRAGLYRIINKPWTRDDLVITVREALHSVVQRDTLARTYRELQRSMQRLRHMALHDALTGLPNRQQFDQALAQALGQAQAQNCILAVLFLDLDRFKVVNDTLGHAAGDLLLRIVVERLRRCVRDKDLIARWGGDEFTVLLPHLPAVEEAYAVARRILAELEPVIEIDGHELRASASIGIALYPRDGTDAQTLVKNADAALYRVKAEGRNGWSTYESKERGHGTTRLALEAALHGVVDRGELVLHYQPQVGVESGAITHAEALLRWNHPSLGLVSPADFIPIAEESGLIVPIGEWVLREACRQAQAWRDEGVADLCVSVNVAALQFERTDLPALVRQVLAASALPAARLELEVTEATGLRSTANAAATLGELQALGVSIALDDFGTGYAPLSHVKDLPCDVLKIDRSFVRALERGSKDAAIVAAVIALGRGLGLQVVAEGVETAAAEALLRELGCSRLQGYRLGRPVDAATLTQALMQSPLRSQQRSHSDGVDVLGRESDTRC